MARRLGLGEASPSYGRTWELREAAVRLRQRYDYCWPGRWTFMRVYDIVVNALRKAFTKGAA